LFTIDFHWSAFIQKIYNFRKIKTYENISFKELVDYTCTIRLKVLTSYWHKVSIIKPSCGASALSVPVI